MAISASSEDIEIEEHYRLPSDYDIHIEEHQEVVYIDKGLDEERTLNLQCPVKSYDSNVLDFEPSQHILSFKKLRIWAPLREIEPVDIVGVVQVATIMIFVLLLAILLCTSYKVRGARRIQPLV